MPVRPSGPQIDARRRGTRPGRPLCPRIPRSPAAWPAYHRVARAMTLVEVLVASILLGVGVVGLLTVGTLALRNQQRVDQRAGALCLAQDRLAEVENVGPRVWTLGRPMHDSQELNGILYDWTLKIDSLSAGQLYSVLVEVSWPGPSGGNVKLETWLNDYEAAAKEKAEQRSAAPR